MDEKPSRDESLPLAVFQQAVKRTRLSETTRDAAHKVLVEGMRPVDVADMFGISRARMSAIIKRIHEAVADIPQRPMQLEVLEADFSIAVRLARARLGDQVLISKALDDAKYLGEVIDRTEFHLVQNLGRNQVVIHNLAKLDQIPALNTNVEIQYTQGRAALQAKFKERRGHSL